MSETRSDASPDEGAPAHAAAGFRGVWKIALLLAAVLIALTVVYVTPLKELMSKPAEASARLRQMGWMAPAAFTLVVAVLVAVGVPRLLLCLIGGMAFGFLQGLLWAQIGTLIGAYGSFVVARWSGHRTLLQKWPVLRRYEHALSKGGIWTVVLAKQLPINGFLVNAILALTRITHRDFLVGTAIGVFPEAVPATLIGAGAVQGSFGRSALYISMAVALFAVVALILRWVARRSRLTVPGSDPAAPDGAGRIEHGS